MMNELLAKLAQPFHPSRISFRAGAVNRDNSKALALAYADLRAYQDRLDEVCGMDWAVTYTPWGDRLICNLTIGGVTRSSTGESEDGTSAEAQAFKRACAMFGLGRYLYAFPSTWVDFDASTQRFTAQAKAKLQGAIAQNYQRCMSNK